MKERTGIKFLDDLFTFLDNAIDSGAEVHIVDRSDPDNVTEHVFNAEEEPDDDLPFADEDICPYDGACEECPYEEECAADLAGISDCSGNCNYCCDDLYGTEPDMWGIPDIDHIVFSEPATIVFWDDGTKTVCKCMEGEKYERYAGFMACCMKKMFGSTSRAKSVMRYFTIEQTPKEKKHKKEVSAPDLETAYNEVVVNREAIQEAVNEALSR